ncbi:MAG: hypothetical protein O2871_01720 [bacterium]|nr:hypothetical protein [bacterium]
MKLVNVIAKSIVGFILTATLLVGWLLFVSYFTKPLKGFNEGYKSFFIRLTYYNPNVTQIDITLASPIILMQTNFLNTNPIVIKNGPSFGKQNHFFSIYQTQKHIGYWEYQKIANQTILIFYAGEISILILLFVRLSKKEPAIIGIVYAVTVFHLTLNILGTWALFNIG